MKSDWMNVEINFKSKMAKSWDMLEICASRTNAAGSEEVLVVWRPTWEPVDWVNSGAVWDAWVQEQADFKARAERTEKIAAVAKTANNESMSAGAEAAVRPDAAVEPGAAVRPDAVVKPIAAVGRIAAVRPGAGKSAMLSLKRPVRVVEKAASLAIVGTTGTAATVTGIPIKKGRGRPPKTKM
jgi:hypothetical protein